MLRWHGHREGDPELESWEVRQGGYGLRRNSDDGLQAATKVRGMLCMTWGWHRLTFGLRVQAQGERTSEGKVGFSDGQRRSRGTPGEGRVTLMRSTWTQNWVQRDASPMNMRCPGRTVFAKVDFTEFNLVIRTSRISCRLHPKNFPVEIISLQETYVHKRHLPN